MKIKNHLESYLRVSWKKEVHRNTIEQQTHTTFVLSNYMHLIAIYHSPIGMSRHFMVMKNKENYETHLRISFFNTLEPFQHVKLQPYPKYYVLWLIIFIMQILVI